MMSSSSSSLSMHKRRSSSSDLLSVSPSQDLLNPFVRRPVVVFESMDAFQQHHLELESSRSSSWEATAGPHQTSSGLLLTHRVTATHRSPDNASRNHVYPPPLYTTMPHRKAHKLLRIHQGCILLSCIALWFGTMVLWHASRHEGVTPEALTQSRNAETVISNQTTTVERIILVPLPFNTTVHSQRRRLGGMLAPQRSSSSSSPPLLQQLRDDFDKWMHHHGKSYSSHDEYQHRFRIWSDNHERTRHKNERHGPCRLTQQPVFSPNLFSDLEPNEFQKQYLTGYKGPTTDQLTHERLLQSRHLLQSNNYHSYNCIWYDASCWLRWFVKTYAYGVGGTLEPSSAAYPSSLDWRDHGVVSDVHTQGACGACWAITAVETIESAHALQTGTLIDLAEAEVILCQDSCELCNGGWPQNAYEYVEQQGGLPADTDFGYNADFLLEITYAKTGESDKYDFDTITTQYCPKDNNNNKNRYAKLKGYGYATDRCVCYTDGTGCDCDDQNEALAIRNLASHGPATVCLEASLWQDYAGGIISSESGCSSKFLDMNHCVQVVGYAFDTNDKEDQQSKSHDSRDDTIREGYWIVRNQWSENWGMNGYAYVAMGANTCGVLNDMTQVYMD